VPWAEQRRARSGILGRWLTIALPGDQSGCDPMHRADRARRLLERDKELIERLAK
jgi:hypothetical protein